MESPVRSARVSCSQESGEESQSPSVGVNLSNGVLESASRAHGSNNSNSSRNSSRNIDNSNETINKGGNNNSNSNNNSSGTINNSGNDNSNSSNNSSSSSSSINNSTPGCPPLPTPTSPKPTQTEPKQPPMTSQKSPRVKFRWCGGLNRLTPASEVSLVLTSLTGTQIPLVWVPTLGWYESDVVPLSCGYHSGFVLVLDKMAPSKAPSYEERDYKVDSFFVTPHNQAIELFLQTDRPIQFWQDIPPLRRRYLSSDHVRDTTEFVCSSGGEYAVHTADFPQGSEARNDFQRSDGLLRPPFVVGAENTKAGESRFSSGFPGRCVSLQELQSFEVIGAPDDCRKNSMKICGPPSASAKKFPNPMKFPKIRSIVQQQEGAIDDACHRDFSSTLVERLSGTNNIAKGGSPTDSSYHSRSRSVFLEDIISENTASLDRASLTSRSDEGKPSLKEADVNWQRMSDSNLNKSEKNVKSATCQDGNRGNDWLVTQQSLIQSKRALSKAELDMITFETEAQIRAVEQLLESSDSDFEDHEEHENILPVITTDMFQSIEIDSSSQQDSPSLRVAAAGDNTNQNVTEKNPALNNSHQSSVLRDGEALENSRLSLNFEALQLSCSRSNVNESNSQVLNLRDHELDESLPIAVNGCLDSSARNQTKIPLGEAGEVGPFGCVITFESRSTSLDDVGSPRALEEALVSLTSNNNVSDGDSNRGISYPPSKPARSTPEMVVSREGNVPVNGNVEHSHIENGGHLLEHEVDSLYDVNDVNVVSMVTDNLRVDNEYLNEEVAFSFDPDDFITSSMMDLDGGNDQKLTAVKRETTSPVLLKKKDLVFREVVEARSPNYLVAEASEVEEYNFQYGSEDSEGGQFPIDIRGVNSDDSSNINFRRRKPSRIDPGKVNGNQEDHTEVVVKQEFVTKTTTIERVTIDESDEPSRLQLVAVSSNGKRHRSRRLDRRRHSDAVKRGSPSDGDFESGKKLTRSKGKLDLKNLSDQMDTTIESDEDMKFDTKKSTEDSLTEKSSNANRDFIMCEVTVTPKATKRIMVSKDIQCSLSSRDKKERNKKAIIYSRTKQSSKKRTRKYSLEKARRRAERCDREHSDYSSVNPSKKCFKESSGDSDSERSSPCSRVSDDSLTGVSSFTKTTPTSDSSDSRTRTSQQSESVSSQLKLSSDSPSDSATTDIDSKSFRLDERLSDKSEESSQSSYKPPDISSSRCCSHKKCQAIHQLRKTAQSSTKTGEHEKRFDKLLETTGENYVQRKQRRHTSKSKKCVASQTSARLNYPSRGTSMTQRTCDKEILVELSTFNDNTTQTNGNGTTAGALGFSVLPNKFTPPARDGRKSEQGFFNPDHRPPHDLVDHNLISELTKLEQHFHRLQRVERSLEGIRRPSPRRRYTNLSSSTQGLNRINTLMSTTSEDEQHRSNVHVHTHQHHHHSNVLQDDPCESRSESFSKRVATSLPSSPSLQRRTGYPLHTKINRLNAAEVSSRLTKTKDALNSCRSTARSELTTTSSLLQPSYIRKVMSFEPYTTRIIRSNNDLVEDFKPYNTNTNITLNRTYSLDSSKFPLAQTHDLARAHPYLHLHSSTTSLLRTHRVSKNNPNEINSSAISDHGRSSPFKEPEDLLDGLRNKLDDLTTDRSSRITFLDQSAEGAATLGARKGSWTSHSLGDVRCRLTPESSGRQPVCERRTSAMDGSRATIVRRRLRFETDSPHRTTTSSHRHLDAVGPASRHFESSSDRRFESSSGRSFEPTSGRHSEALSGRHSEALFGRHFESSSGRHFLPRAASYSGGLNREELDYSSSSAEDVVLLSDCDGSTDCLLEEAERLATRIPADSKKQFYRPKVHRKQSPHEQHKTLASRTFHSSTTEASKARPFLPAFPADLAMGQLVKILLPSLDESGTTSLRAGTITTEPSQRQHRAVNTPSGNVGVHTRGSGVFASGKGLDESCPGASKRGGGVAVGRVVFIDQVLNTTSLSKRFRGNTVDQDQADVVVMLQKESSQNWPYGAPNAVVQVPFSKVLLAWPLQQH